MKLKAVQALAWLHVYLDFQIYTAMYFVLPHWGKKILMANTLHMFHMHTLYVNNSESCQTKKPHKGLFCYG